MVLCTVLVGGEAGDRVEFVEEEAAGCVPFVLLDIGDRVLQAREQASKAT